MAVSVEEENDYLGRDIHVQIKGDIECFIDSHYEITEIIGRGAYSIVFGGINKETGKNVAIKKIKKEILEDEINTKRILREVNILRQVKHEAIIEMLDIIPSRTRAEFTECYIVFDRMATDMRKLINSTTKLSKSHVTYLGYQMFRAIKYLHSVGVVHRDLTPANILVSQQCQIKICDFGLSRKVPDELTPMTRHVVTRWYRAPEIMCWDEYAKPVDIWAAACILAELFLRRPIFPGDHFIHQLNLIFDVIGTPKDHETTNITESTILCFIRRLEQKPRQEMAEVFKGTPATEVVHDLFSKLFVFNPRERIEIEGILSHPYFQEWHDPSDEPVGNIIQVEFEDIECIEQIKDLLWKEIVLMTKHHARKTSTEY